MKKKLLIIIIAAVVVIGGGVFFLITALGGEKSEKPIVYGYYSPGDVFVINVKESRSLLKTGIVLILNTEDAKLQEEMKVKNAQIRDTIIFLLRDLSEDDIISADKKENLRQDLIEQLNSLLEIDNIVGVAFNDFVTQ